MLLAQRASGGLFGALRLTLGLENGPDDVERLLAAIPPLVAEAFDALKEMRWQPAARIAAPWHSTGNAAFSAADKGRTALYADSKARLLVTLNE